MMLAAALVFGLAVVVAAGVLAWDRRARRRDADARDRAHHLQEHLRKNDEHAESMKRDACATIFVREWPRMDEEQIRKALAGWRETDPKFRAVWDLISTEYEAEMISLASLQPDAKAMLEWKGRMQMIMLLRDKLLQVRGSGG
jgi:hypothetical protein